jgi:hypothetical protein
MFFACGAWALLMQTYSDETKKNNWLTFLAHLCLCNVHYLGIIFSALIGLSLLISNNGMPIIKRIPFAIFAVWVITIPIHLFLLGHQSSHLGNWPKPNALSDLLAGYNNSLLLLTILIPLFLLIINKSDSGTKTRSIEETQCSRPTTITSLLWLSVPFVFWIISNLTSLNLFVDRYFIPKESALIVIVAYGFSFLFQKILPLKSLSFPILGTLGLSLVLILVSTKRAVFGLHKDSNYHHSLIIKKTYPTSMQPITLEGDPKYFPNAYLGNNQYVFLISDDHLLDIYSKYSKRLVYRSE